MFKPTPQIRLIILYRSLMLIFITAIMLAKTSNAHGSSDLSQPIPIDTEYYLIRDSGIYNRNGRIVEGSYDSPVLVGNRLYLTEFVDTAMGFSNINFVCVDISSGEKTLIWRNAKLLGSYDNGLLAVEIGALDGTMPRESALRRVAAFADDDIVAGFEYSRIAFYDPNTQAERFSVKFCDSDSVTEVADALERSIGGAK